MYASVGINTYNDSKRELRDFLLSAKYYGKKGLKFINRNDVAFISGVLFVVIGSVL